MGVNASTHLVLGPNNLEELFPVMYLGREGYGRANQGDGLIGPTRSRSHL
jgi:hypothetical protein